MCYFVDKNFPLVKFSQRNSLQKAWVNDCIRSSSRNLKSLFYLQKELPELENHYEDVKRNHLQLIRDAKRNFYQSQINVSSSNTKDAWGVVNELTNSNKFQTNINIQMEGASSLQDVANSINEYFHRSVSEIVCKIPKSEKVENIALNNKSFFLNPFVPSEIYLIIKYKLNNKKSSGPDGIPVFLLKCCAETFAVPLCQLVNKSFETGIFPRELKLSKIIPVFKKGDPKNVQNYRPISLSNTLSKIFELCFLDRLKCFLNKCSILTTNQHGYTDNFNGFCNVF